MEAIRARINYHPVTISRLWRSVMQESLKYLGNERVLMIRYEDLIASPEETIQMLCKKTGIVFDKKMLQIPVTGSSNASDTPGKTGVDTSRATQWEKGAVNETEIGICQEMNYDIMEKFGYKIKAVYKNSLLNFGYKLILPFQLVLIGMVNVKRWKYYMRRI